MGGTYKRKTQQGCDAEILKRAAASVSKGEMSVRKAASSYEVPRTTLHRYVSRPEADCQSSYHNCKKAYMVFTEEMEDLMAQHVRDLDHRYHGIGPVKARELAWEFGKRNGITRMPQN